MKEKRERERGSETWRVMAGDLERECNKEEGEGHATTWLSHVLDHARGGEVGMEREVEKERGKVRTLQKKKE